MTRHFKQFFLLHKLLNKLHKYIKVKIYVFKAKIRDNARRRNSYTNICACRSFFLKNGQTKQSKDKRGQFWPIRYFERYSYNMQTSCLPFFRFSIPFHTAGRKYMVEFIYIITLEMFVLLRHWRKLNRTRKWDRPLEMRNGSALNNKYIDGLESAWSQEQKFACHCSHKSVY